MQERMSEGKAASATRVPEYRLGITQEDVEKELAFPITALDAMALIDSFIIKQGMGCEEMGKQAYLHVMHAAVYVLEHMLPFVDEETRKERERLFKSLTTSPEKLIWFFRNQP